MIGEAFIGRKHEWKVNEEIPNITTVPQEETSQKILTISLKSA